MDITYNIDFFSEWHCGSGLSGGATTDALLIKDKHNLPFIPGKTIKGLLREAVEDILSLGDYSKYESSFFEAFGYSDGQNEIHNGCAFFTNAHLRKDLRDIIINKDLHSYLYRKTASTAIGENGIAKKHSLRVIKTSIPCTLEGQILNVPDHLGGLINSGLMYIKRIGVNRNRGLGRCNIKIIKLKEGEKYENITI